jgi:hypothetical protein
MYGMLTWGQNSNSFNIPWKLTDRNRDGLIEHSRWLIYAVKVYISLMFAYLNWAVVQVALRRADGIGAWFMPVFLGGILVLLVRFYLRGKEIADLS